MGICFSTTKVSGSKNNNNNNNNNNNTAIPNRKWSSKKMKEERQNQNHRTKDKVSSRRQGGHVPCGKRTDFGYEKDFDRRFSLGKLLGHGQFGYTYVGIDEANGDRVAVKRLEKNKVIHS